MGTGGTPTLESPKGRSSYVVVRCSFKNDERRTSNDERVNIDGANKSHSSSLRCAESEFYGQAERAISNGQLSAFLRLHIRPINVVVYHGPY
jgi:hypothetical protein